jgi:hypothetical protein
VSEWRNTDGADYKARTSGARFAKYLCASS